MKKTFKRYAPVAAIIIIILLLANIASTLQYAKISSNYSYGVARAEPTFYQYLHKNGTEYQTNSTIGNQPSTNYVRIDDGNYQEWVQVPGMDYDRAIKLLYSKLYIEAFIGKKLRINGSSGDYAGWNVTSVDLNCDGYSDIVIGAPYNDSSDGSRTDCGCVYIFFGYEGILDKDYFDPEDANITIYGENTDDRFGWSLANVSHFNNTNYYDLIVGTGNITGPGKVYVFYGNDSSNWPSTMSASDANITIIGGSNGDRFGCSVGGGFDSNHDGYDDIVVGAYLNDTTDGSETDAGAVYVFFGNTLPTGVNDANITVNGKKAGDNFGFACAYAGNVNDTNPIKDDFIAGAPFANDTGRAYIFYGGGYTNNTAFWNLSTTNANVTLVGENTGDKFGFSVFGVNDVNNDNYDDVVVGAPGYDNSRGRVYIYFGNAYMGNGGADPPLEGGKGVKAEWIGVISACSEDGDLKVVHSDINVDGDSDDWFPIEPTKEENKEIYQIEYTWKDLDNDNIGFASPDITTIRWCEDSEKMNFLLKIKNYTDEPIAIFIDTTQGPSGGRYENYGFNYNFNEWDAWEYAIIHDERRHYTYTLDYHTWNSRKSVSDNIIEISAPIKFNPAHATINVLVGKEPKDSARIPDVVDPRIVYDSIYQTVNYTCWWHPFITTTFSNGLPSGWTTEGSAPAANGYWHSNKPANPAGVNTTYHYDYMVSDTYLAGAGATNVWMNTSLIDCTSYSTVRLRFYHYYNQYSEVAPEGAYVYVRVGATNNQVYSSVVDAGPEEVIIDISSYAAGQSNVKILFNYVANDDYWWQVSAVDVEYKGESGCWKGTVYNDLNTVKNAGVIRRNSTFNITATGLGSGTTITVKGPCDIGEERPTVTGWNPQWNAAGSNWSLTVPSNAAVGDYQVYADDSYFTLYVIFDVFLTKTPSGMTDAEFASWAYDETCDNSEYAVVRPPDNSPAVSTLYCFDENVTELAVSIMGGQVTNPYNASINVYRLVNARITWQGTSQSDDAGQLIFRIGTGLTTDISKKVALQTGDTLPLDQVIRGQCNNYGTIFVALARSMGIPSRVVNSYTIWGWNFHTWSEAYIDNPDMSLASSDKKWLVFDPTDQSTTTSQNSNGESSIDTEHDTFYHGSVLDVTPKSGGTNATVCPIGSDPTVLGSWSQYQLYDNYSCTFADLPEVNLTTSDNGYLKGELGGGDRDFFKVNVSGLSYVDVGFLEGGDYADIYVNNTTIGSNTPDFAPNSDLKTAYLSTLVYGDYKCSATIPTGVTWLYIMVDNAKEFQYADDYANDEDRDASSTTKDCPHGMGETHHYKLGIGKCPAKVTVTSPNGAETALSGGTYNITWNVTHVNYSKLATQCINISVSTDGGSSWTSIATGEANDGWYIWTVSSSLDKNITCRINITCNDTNGKTGYDISDANFTIKGDPTNLGYVCSGASTYPSNERFGWNVTYANVNNDTYNDTIVGAPYNTTPAGLTGGGAVYVFFGFDGIDNQDLNPGNANVTIYGEWTDAHFGWSVACAGDVNETTDKWQDIVVGCPDTTNGNAYVIEGYNITEQAVGDGIIYVNDADGGVTNISGGSSGDKFGFSVGGGGDLNNDNYNDVIIGAPYNDASGSNAGRAYIFHGGSNGITATGVSSANATFTGKYGGDNFGYAVSNIGDINSDGYDDVAVGSPGYDNNRGKASIHYGSEVMGEVTKTYDTADYRAGSATIFGYIWAADVTFNTRKLKQGTETLIGAAYESYYDFYWADDNGYQVLLDYANAVTFRFEFHVTEPRDIISEIGVVWRGSQETADSHTLYIWNYTSATWESLESSTVIALHFLSGSKNNGSNYIDPNGIVNVVTYRVDPGLVAREFRMDYFGINITYTNVTDVLGENNGDKFGFSVSNLGDVNGDSVDDFAAGAPGYESSKGRVYIYHGSPHFELGVYGSYPITQQPGDNGDHWVGKDCWLDEGNPTFNYGISTGLNVKYSATDSEKLLIQFDVSMLSSNTVITNAELKLNCYAGTVLDSVTISLYRVTNPWHEGINNGVAATGTPAGATWNNRVGTTAWTTAGGDYDSTAETSTSVSSYGWYTWDITSLVQKWVNGTANNYGLILVGTGGVADSAKTFYSADYATDHSLAPKLEITLRKPLEAHAITGGKAGDQFGYSIDGGDVDESDYSDIIVGAPYNDTITANRDDGGACYLFLGDGNIPDDAGEADYVWYGPGASNYTGFSVSYIGEMGGEVDPIIIGSPNWFSWKGNVTIVGCPPSYTVTFNVTTVVGFKTNSTNYVTVTLSGMSSYQIYDGHNETVTSIPKNTQYTYSFNTSLSDDSTRRWVNNNSAQVNGIAITSSGTVIGYYYEQYYMTFNATTAVGQNLNSTNNVTVYYWNNGTEYSGKLWDGTPGQQQTAWADNGSAGGWAYNYTLLSSGSSSSRRWVNNNSNQVNNQITGFIPAQAGTTIKGYYYEQFWMTYQTSTVVGYDLNSSNYATVNYTNNGSVSQVNVWDAQSQTAWCDNTTQYNYTNLSSDSSSTRRWVNYPWQQGTILTSETVTGNYYEQYYMTFNATTQVGEKLSSTNYDNIQYVANSSMLYVQIWDGNNGTVWCDNTTQYNYTNLSSNSGTNRRWFNSPWKYGTISGSTTEIGYFYEQYSITFNATTEPAAGWDLNSTNNVTVYYWNNGTEYSGKLWDASPGQEQTVWADNGSASGWAYNYTLLSSASTNTRRWTNNNSNQVNNQITGFIPNQAGGTIRGYYFEQYYISVSTSGDYLNSTYPNKLYWYENNTQLNTDIYDALSPVTKWMDNTATFNVSTPVQGPTTPRNVKYVCDDPSAKSSEDNLTWTFLFHAEFSSDVNITGEAVNDEFGFTVCGGGDYNDDNIADVSAGAPGKNRVYLFFGKTSWSNISASDADKKYDGDSSNDRFGTCVYGPQIDVNKDGRCDLLVGAPYNNTYKGRVYAYVPAIIGTVTVNITWASNDPNAQDIGNLTIDCIGTAWYNKTATLSSTDIVVHEGYSITMNITVSAEGGYINLYYDSATYDSRYEIRMMSVASASWVKTYDNTTKAATNLWCAVYNKSAVEDVLIKANISVESGYSVNNISSVNLTLKTGSNNIVSGYDDVGMIQEKTGTEWALYNYTINIGGLDPGLYKVIIKTTDEWGLTDDVKGECNSRVVWFRVVA